MELTLILSFGLDPELLRARNLLLQSEGYTVVSASSLKEAVDRFLAGDFDLVLLCQSIPPKERDRLTSLIRASGSRIPVVSVAEKICQDDAFGRTTVDSDPDALLMGIWEELVKAAIPAVRSAAPVLKQEMAAAQREKPPRSSAGYERQTKVAQERLVPLAHTG